MTGFSTRMMPVIILLLAAPMQAQTQTQPKAQTQRFPAFDPEQIFMLGDADLDGRLSLDEYRDFLRSSPRMKNAAAAVEPMFRRLDADRDGFLSLAEYRKSFPQRPGGTAAKPGTPKGKPPGAAAPEVGITPEQEQFFEAKIRPVLATHCGECHASTAEKLRGGLRLDNREALRLGGDSGPAIIPGQPDESLLLCAIRYRDEDLQMPPKGKLPDAVVAELAATLARKRDRLAEGLAAAGFDVLASQATYFINADGTPLGAPDATALCEQLPLEAGVVAIPTSAFAADPTGPTRPLVRFAFPKSDEVLEEGIARLARWRAASA